MPSVQVSPGMILLAREPEHNGMPERFKLWAVKSVRRGKRGVSATLILGDEQLTATATATFPGGLVAGNWQVFSLSQRDLAHVWRCRAAALNAEPASEA